jgi:hypothetical protein
MDTKSPDSWSYEPKTACLRVAVDSSRTLILPYSHFQSAELRQMAGGGEELKLLFASHQIVLAGRFLKRLEVGIANQEIGEVRVTPERFRGMEAERAILNRIQVEEVSRTGERPEEGTEHE